jgi:hypothetical protein
LVFGYGFTSTNGGEPYHDLQGDHVICDDDMIKAALDFVATGARADVMHDHLDRGGYIPFVMPLTAEIAKAFGLEGGETGLMIGMRPDEETYAKFKSGEYTAFSIDGVGERELIDDAVGKLDVAKLSDEDLKILSEIVAQHKGKEAKPDEPAQKEQDAMTIEDLKKKNDELADKLNKALAFGSLADAEKAYRAGLPSDEQDAWVAKSRADRGADIAKAAKADGVVFKAADGTEYRKSDDPRLIKLAKERDADAERLASEVAKREAVELEKRADVEVGNFTGTVQVRAAMLKAIDGIADEDTRKAAHESLKGANDSVARMYTTVGEHTRKSTDDPQAKIDTLVAKRMTETNEARGVAYRKVLETPEGEALYNEHISTRN